MLKLKTLAAAVALSISLLFVTGVTTSHGMDFKFNPKTAELTMSGTIEPGDFIKKFLPVVLPNINKIIYVVLESPGGALNDGIAMGDFINKMKYNTVSSMGCYSACAYIWLAGDHRFVDIKNGTAIGFHMPYQNDWAYMVPAGPDTVKSLEKYFRETGIPEDMIRAIEATPGGPDEDKWPMLMLTFDLADRWGLNVLYYMRN